MNMMKLIIPALVTLAIPFGAQAASLQDQLKSIHTAEVAAKKIEAQQSIDRKEQESIAAKKKRDKVRQETKKAAAKQSEVNRRIDEDRAQKKSQQARLFELEIQAKQIELQSAKARANRTDDFIDSELARDSAMTAQEIARADAIQSEADANRNISSGVKTLLEKEGESKVEESSSFW